MPLNINERLVVSGFGAYGLQALHGGVSDRYAEVEADDDNGLMLEAVTLEEVEHYYLGDADVIQAQSAMFEAISTQRQKLAQTMRAFSKVLNRGLNGTDISAGTENSDDTDDTGALVGGAIISKVRRVSGIPVMAAKIPLSDGQSVSIVFHSPTSNGKTVANSDLLVAFQFLLNKRDVTHVVAPIGGKDVSLAQVAQSLSNLIEKNSGKFKKQKDVQAKTKAEIDAIAQEADKLEDQRSDLLTQIGSAQAQADTATASVTDLSKQLADQKAINADLQKHLDALNNAPAPTPEQAITDNLRTVKQNISMGGRTTLSNGATLRVITIDDGEPRTYAVIETQAGDVFQVEAESMQGGSVNDAVGKLFKAYRAGKAEKIRVPQAPDAGMNTADPQPEASPPPPPPPAPQPEPETTPPPVPAGYRYALFNRPASLGTIPDGQTAILPTPDKSDPYSIYARHGYVMYAEPLSDAQMGQFELKAIPSQAEYAQYAQKLAQGALSSYAAEYLEMVQDDTDTFKKTVAMRFKKAFPNVAYPQGDDVNAFMTDVIAALTELAQPEEEPEPQPEPVPTPQPEPEPQPQPEPETAPAPAPEPQPQPEPETAPAPEPEPQPEPDPVPEVDQQTAAALAVLNGMFDFQSDITADVKAKIQEAKAAANALVNAGEYDSNEDLINRVVDHLVGLLQAIQQKVAA